MCAIFHEATSFKFLYCRKPSCLRPTTTSLDEIPPTSLNVVASECADANDVAILSGSCEEEIMGGLPQLRFDWARYKRWAPDRAAFASIILNWEVSNDGLRKVAGEQFSELAN